MPLWCGNLKKKKKKSWISSESNLGPQLIYKVSHWSTYSKRRQWPVKIDCMWQTTHQPCLNFIRWPCSPVQPMYQTYPRASQRSSLVWQCLRQDFNINSANIYQAICTLCLYQLSEEKRPSWDFVFKCNLVCQARALLSWGCLNRNQSACCATARSKTSPQQCSPPFSCPVKGRVAAIEPWGREGGSWEGRGCPAAGLGAGRCQFLGLASCFSSTATHHQWAWLPVQVHSSKISNPQWFSLHWAPMFAAPREGDLPSLQVWGWEQCQSSHQLCTSCSQQPSYVTP